MNGLEAALLLTTLLAELGLAAQRFNALMAQAKAEGRDLTDEEIEGVRASSRAAVDRYMAG